ncbi:hypothetical protein [Pseudarthrobacter sp. N5]|uniref:hypothetical protein n=1 Tax=Pseudarthrobacter sp. N5 TaxID=3418416 RepID=UPI003CF3D3CC
MNFELRTIPGCPNSPAAHELFQQALALEGLEPEIGTLDVTDDGQAVALRFHGSPSFVADGRDLFPSDGEPAVSCRIYRNGTRLSGLPALEDLRRAIRNKG